MLLALIKADFYQMRSRKGLWLLLGLIVLLTAGIVWIAVNVMKEEHIIATQNIANLVLFGAPQWVLEPLTMIIVFLAQIVSFNNDNKNRTLINTVSYGTPRPMIFIGKVAATFLTTVIIYSSILLTLCIALSILTPNIAVQDMGNLWRSYWLPALPIWLAFSTLFSILPLITKSNGAQVFLFILVSNVGSVLKLIELFVIRQSESFKWLTDAKWLLTRLSTRSPLHFGSLTFDFTAVVALVYVLIFAAIGITLFKRSEIK